MIIKNGAVFQEDGLFKKQDLYIENHKIVASREEVSDDMEVDASGLLVIPGLIDIHSHGAAGHDFSDGDAQGLRKILKYEREHGITSYCPTSVTLPKERLKKIFATILEVKDYKEGATVLGINMEGPFIDPKKKGAHEESFIHKPSAEFFRECNKACGNKIKLTTLAPNMEDGMKFIDEMHDEVCISLGHTSMDYDTAAEAIKRGAHHVTHLYNAMQPLGHRDPGLIGAAFDDGESMVELISDGFHIHPSVVRATFALFGPERVILVSDSMMATGMPNGSYKLGDLNVTMKDRKATLDDGTLAGSATDLYDCMRCAVSFGVPREQAIWAATRNPAKSIGIYDKVGSLTPGKEADVLLVDEDLKLRRVI